MSSDAHRVTLDQVRQAFEILGFDTNLSTLRELHMEPGRITVTRFRLDENGKSFVAGYNDMATETVVVAVVSK
jgi:hypothetical protein